MQPLTLGADWPASWKLSHHYDRMEAWGERLVAGHAHAYATRLAETLAMIGRAAAPPARVLDVAAAQGNYSLALAALGYDVTWNDLRADLADYVRLKAPDAPLRYAPGDAFDLAPGSFDVLLVGE